VSTPARLYKDEHELFRKTVKAFIDREIAPNYERWEKEGQVSREVWKRAGAEGLLLTDIPEEYGGAGADFLYSAVMIEEMAKRVFTAPACTPTLSHLTSSTTAARSRSGPGCPGWPRAR
jgi:acyl-CoA dehydrogenase